MRCLAVVAATLLGALSFAGAQEIPAGTVIPVMVTVKIDSAKAQAGQPITGKVMEQVPLANNLDIAAGAKVYGHIQQVIPAAEGEPSSVTVAFESVMIHGRPVPIHANLRALASMMAVYDAQVPLFEPDTTPRSAVMLTPVGGEAAFRPDDPEKDARKLVRFSGPLPEGCGGRIDMEGGTGSLWVFSPYACGVYGFGKGVVIVKNGSAEPEGDIVLGSRKNFTMEAGSGWLLRVGPRVLPAEASAQ